MRTTLTGQKRRNREQTYYSFHSLDIMLESHIQSPEFSTFMLQIGQALSSFIHFSFEDITSTQLTWSLCSWWPHSTWLSEVTTSNQCLVGAKNCFPGMPWGGHESCLWRHFCFMVHTFKTSWHSGLAEQSLCTCYEHGRFPGAPNIIAKNGNVMLASPMKCLLLVSIFLNLILHTHCWRNYFLLCNSLPISNCVGSNQ